MEVITYDFSHARACKAGSSSACHAKYERQPCIHEESLHLQGMHFVQCFFQPYVIDCNDDSCQKDSGQAHNACVCWCYCRAAAVLRPDSNVPNNNIANSYLSLERVDDALDEAKEAFRRKIDYMTSVTCLSNPTTLSMCPRLSLLVLLSQFLAPSLFLSHSLSFWSLCCGQ